MITTEGMHSTKLTDANLVADCLKGNRDAFRLIVERYQTLISSLAYSATGNVSQSEDLAQDTFVSAWKQLADLREPAKLRPWLCSITRFLISKEFRRQGREPIHAAEALEALDERTAPGPLPPDHVISEEEKAILWRSLERIPEVYREPLVLFYRKHQSIEAVARELELSEDAVKQRLSRGRKLLQEQFLAFVAGALERTNTGKAFTLAVVASLPALTFSAKAATVGATAAKGSAAAKTAGIAGMFGALLGPLIVLFPNYLAYRVTLAGAQTDEERADIKSFFGKVGAITLALFLPFAAVVLWLSRNQTDHSHLTGLFATGVVLIFLPTMFVIAHRSKRKTREYYSGILAEQYAGVFPKPAWEYRCKLSLFGLPLVHIRVGDRFSLSKEPVKAWIAVGDRAIGGLFACGGLAIAPVSVGGLSLGILSIGGLSLGGVALGGIALGVWALFGGLVIGWQAVGCIAIAWNAALGNFAFTCFPHNPSDSFLRYAQFVNDHWLWLNLFWSIPFFVQWLILRRAKRDA
jgi:RNA polymerase sigma factor (sigma-70 family)